ncbi:MAG: tetratricopeptide repeat protein, partial [Alkalispirochaeta sp.]
SSTTTPFVATICCIMDIALPIDPFLAELFPHTIDVPALRAVRTGAHDDALRVLLSFYSHGSATPTVSVDRESVTVHVPALPKLESDDPRVQEALRLLEADRLDEARRAAEELLKLDPSVALLHRIRASGFHAADNHAAAIDAYRTGLCWNPEDLPMLISAAQVLLTDMDDVGRAHVYLERARTVAPGDPQVLLGQAVLADYQDDWDGAFRFGVEVMKAAEAESEEFTYGLNLTHATARKIAHHRIDSLEELTRSWAETIATKSGRPISIERQQDLPVPAMLHIAEPHNLDRHQIYYREPSLHAYHLIMNQLTVLRRTVEARDAGKSIIAGTTEAQVGAFKSDFGGAVEDSPNGDAYLSQLFAAVNGQIISTPTDLFVEAILHDELPEFRPVQFLGLRNLVEAAERSLSHSSAPADMPAQITRVSAVLNLVVAYLYRDLYGHDRAARFNVDADVRDTAQRFYTEFLELARESRPGAEWQLVRNWGSELGVLKYVMLRDDPSPARGPGIPPSSPAVVMDRIVAEDTPERTDVPTGDVPDRRFDRVIPAILGALDFFEDLDRRSITQVAQEIAEYGMKGLNPADDQQEFYLKTVPGAVFSGTALLAWLYTAFQVLGADVDPGIDYSAEYAEAVRLREAREE